MLLYNGNRSAILHIADVQREVRRLHQSSAMYEIEFMPDAMEDLQSLRTFEQRTILDNIEVQLRHQPMNETRNRKRLLPNEIAAWELRAGPFRVFYNVDEEKLIVRLEAVGFKVGNILFIRGESRKL